MIETILITGYLGSGKTTLVNALLAAFANEGKSASLLINDFGDVNVDAAIVSGKYASKYDVHSGSIFCSCTAGQLYDALWAIAADAPDVLLVEASGMAAPAAFGQLLETKIMRDAFCIRGNITVVDAGSFTKIAPFFQVARQQVQAADLLLVNKIDLASESELDSLHGVLREFNPDALIERTHQSAIPQDTLARLLPLERMNQPLSDAPPASLAATTLSATLPLDRAAFEEVLDELGDSLLRLKGNINFAGQTRFVSIAGGELHETPAAKLSEDSQNTCFVAITYRVHSSDVRDLFESCIVSGLQ